MRPGGSCISKLSPSGGGTSPMSPQELWSSLFDAAGLRMAEFSPATSEWIPAQGWDAQASWTGIYPDPGRTSVRIEAAAWHGQPVYFEVLPSWRTGTRIPSVVITDRMPSQVLAVFIIVFAISAVLARQNLRLGRGDRRGAFRLAVFIFLGTLLQWACKASHIPAIEEFTLLTYAITWAG